METQMAQLNIGPLIRQLRESKGWTQRRLAEESGVSPQFLSDIEKGYTRDSGRVAKPSDKKINAIAAALGVPPMQLHSAIPGRVDVDSEQAAAIEKQYQELSNDEKKLKLLANYSDLSERDQKIVDRLIGGDRINKAPRHWLGACNIRGSCRQFYFHAFSYEQYTLLGD